MRADEGMKKRVKGPGYWIGLVVAVTIAVLLPKFLPDREERLIASLQKSVEVLNETCPQMLDSDTRLDYASAGPGRKITYFCTILGDVISAADDAELWNEIRQETLETVLASDEMGSLRSEGVSLVYRYKNEAGEFMGQVELTEADYR